ncbi:AraC family transcriptional regulator [Herbaspirillum lusitanum]|uniref:AraC family transcriptional regulator n=1 Tax=Herbaspirillum lusitanum TaxID=213312 RepID=A0ABW9A977_9BURK
MQLIESSDTHPTHQSPEAFFSAPASLPPLPSADNSAEQQALEAGRRELIALLTRHTADQEGSRDTAIPGFFVHRITRPGGPQHAIQHAMFAVIGQGSKRLLVGDETYECHPMDYMVASVDLPVCGKVIIHSPEEPYMGLRLDLPSTEIGELIGDDKLPPIAPADPSRGMHVNRLDSTLLDATLRLLRLLDAPRDIPILAPLIKREIVYRLLMNGEGAMLRQTVLHDSQMNRVAKAIRMLREGFAQPLRIDDIARDVHMSVSSLHHHFKVVTAMSPLQYQKNLRLQEARRLIISTDAGVTMAAHLVGYESTSQFSREYSRLFGAPPLRDKRRWLEEEALSS